MKNILFACVCFVLFSCSNETAVSPNYSPGWQPPVVEGINITNDSGQLLNRWGAKSNTQGNLVSGNSFRSNFMNSGNIYPNPTCGSSRIEFSLPETAKIKIWVSPARWENQSTTDFKFGTGNLLVTAEGARAIAILADGEQVFSKGVHRIDWPDQNQQERIISGFYRIFIDLPDETLWEDLFIGCLGDDVPLGLELYL